MNVTNEEFGRYLTVQKLGITNMFDLKVVTELTNLEKGQCIHIMGNYKKLLAKYEKET